MKCRGFSSLSIKCKFTLIIMVVTASALFCYSVLAIYSNVNLLRRSLVENLTTLGDTIIDLSPSEFTVLNKESAGKLLVSLRAEPGIEMAVIYNPNDIVYSVYMNEQTAAGTILPEEVKPDGYSYQWRQNTIKIEVYQPIVFNGQRVGTLYILSGIGRFYGYLTQFALALLLSFCSILVFTFLFSTRLQKAVFLPLSSLASTAKTISSTGDYSVRVPGNSDDEIGDLVGDFNNMLEAIQVREEELNEHRHNLELLVADRTEELQQKTDEALQAVNSKSEFLANMSHEIRTPMNGIIGVLSLLKEAELGSEHKKLLETASRSADSLLMIINDILDFSKIDAGKVEFETIAYDLREIMEEVSLLFVDSVDGRKTDLICYVPNDVQTALVGDPTRLRQILGNLLSNAIKFTERGEVVLTVEIMGREGSRQFLKFSVKDTGIGIPEESTGKLFEKFSQADGSTTRKYGGTGLGLSVCKNLVELQGGDIGVESRFGSGSVFWFTLPVKVAETGCVKDAPQKVLYRSCLLVDDNETSLAMLNHYLADVPMELNVCKSGGEALELLDTLSRQKRLPELLFIDHHMPYMDGLELAAIISQIYAEQPPRMILLSSAGLVRSGDVINGIDAVITKPVRKSQLYTVLTASTENSGRKGVIAEPERGGRELTGRVLLVDDEHLNQKVGATILKRFGLQVDVAVNGYEAVSMVKMESYDLVLMDIQMPEMSGYEATEAIRQWEHDTGGKETPIVAMTANALESAREKCLAVGMDGFVVKPVKPEVLRERVLPYIDIDEIEKLSESIPKKKAVGTWDRSGALKLVGGDGELLGKMAELFIGRADMLVGNIVKAVENSDPEQLSDAAHAFKGAVNHFCSKELGDLSKDLEEKGRIGQLNGAGELVEKIQQNTLILTRELQQFVDE